MAIASITAWLNSPNKDYHHGRLLYEQYGNSKVVLALIRSGTGNYHFNKLLQALTDLNNETGIEPKQITIAIQPVPVAKPAPVERGINFASAPDKIHEIRARKNEDYAQARHLHESIRFLDTPKLRVEAALRLLDLMDGVNEAWSIIDEWNEKGQIRQQEQEKQLADVSTMTHAELLQEEKRLMPNISKDRTKLQTESNERAILKITARLQARELRIAAVRGRLNEFV